MTTDKDHIKFIDTIAQSKKLTEVIIQLINSFTRDNLTYGAGISLSLGIMYDVSLSGKSVIGCRVALKNLYRLIWVILTLAEFDFGAMKQHKYVGHLTREESMIQCEYSDVVKEQCKEILDMRNKEWPYAIGN
jgi:hypothetical protein